jgi:microcystin-dependent protein
MSQPFIGEIRLFAGNFAPAGWAMCNGQLLPISENEALFILIGTTYGGDGQETFALPNLQSRVPVHQGAGRILGEVDGTESVTVTVQQTAIHTHPYTAATNPASISSPSGTRNAESSQINMFIADAPSTPLAPNAVSAVGGSQPHDNMQPYLVLNFIISLFGVFPQFS